ncbi:MAG: T9SS type A sorting domain-containing protein [Bacteroidetes bacterium]|nr:T9SS type A sorting domain-containing protein [Bacteroidota bacterium]
MRTIIKETVDRMLRPLCIMFVLLPMLSIAQDSLPSALVERYITPGQVHFICNPIVSTHSSTFNGFTVKYYRESIHSWLTLPANVDTVISTMMNGYSILDNSSNPDSCTLRYEGRLNSGNESIVLTRTMVPGTNPPVYDGWNLAGNPYPSASDWESTAWGLNNVDPTIYYFDGVNYKPFNRIDRLGNGSQIIPSMQGFFVHVSSGSLGSLSVTNSSRIHSAQPFYKNSFVQDNLLVLDADGNGYSDETFIQLDSIAESSFDWQYDAYKLLGITQSPQIYSMLTDADASINVLPYKGPNTSVLVGFREGVSGNYTITSHGMNSFIYVTSIVLWDKKINYFQNLMNDSVYSFSSLTSDNWGRFEIFFNYTLNGITGNQPGENLDVYAYRGDVYVKYITEKNISGTITVYDFLGKKVFSDVLQNVPLNKFHLFVNEGYYIAKVISPGKTIVRKVFISR